MAKDPNYDRYAGMVSLPGADGKLPRPFRVDEDGNVIYRDQEPGMGRHASLNDPRSHAQAGILDWDELDRRFDERSEIEVSAAKSTGSGGGARGSAAPTRRRIGGIDYDVIGANTFDPLKSSGATAIPNEDLMATAIVNKKQVAVISGPKERGAFLTVRPSELPWSDRLKIGKTKPGEDEPYLEVPVADSYFSVPKLKAKAGSTVSKSTLGFGDPKKWPKRTIALSHGHIDGGPDQSDGMVDVVDPKDEKSYGDSASLVTNDPIPTATVYRGHVGWHFLENGQLKFMYPIGSEMDDEQRAKIQKNLDRAQVRYQDKPK